MSGLASPPKYTNANILNGKPEETNQLTKMRHEYSMSLQEILNSFIFIDKMKLLDIEITERFYQLRCLCSYLTEVEQKLKELDNESKLRFQSKFANILKGKKWTEHYDSIMNGLNILQKSSDSTEVSKIKIEPHSTPLLNKQYNRLIQRS